LSSQATTSNLMSRNTIGAAFILLSGVAWVAFFSDARILARAD